MNHANFDKVHGLEIVSYSAEGCCADTTMALHFINQKYRYRFAHLLQGGFLPNTVWIRAHIITAENWNPVSVIRLLLHKGQTTMKSQGTKNNS